MVPPSITTRGGDSPLHHIPHGIVEVLVYVNALRCQRVLEEPGWLEHGSMKSKLVSDVDLNFKSDFLLIERIASKVLHPNL